VAVAAVAEGKSDPESPGPRQPPQFTVPPGFVVERVAGPPLVERPMMAGFDDRGRLLVCDSSGFNLMEGTSEILVKNPPHAIRRLEDVDGDGHFDQSTVFADKMTFPMGILWHDGALYTASAPSLWRLEDTDGDGVADRRQEFVTKFDFGGNSCDLHGPFLGPDGRIYWANCQRAFAIRRPDGSLLEGKGAGVFRIRPDGNDIEILCAGGMDNPVEVAFTEEGEAFATVNLFIGYPRPRVDAIIHCVEGGLFPYQELDRTFKRTGDLLPAMIPLGWVAPAGMMRYRSEAFGSGYAGNLFSTQFNTHRVVRHVLERDGATFRGGTEDFLASTDPDFHPTDVLEDADGSLLVVDTGGWFLRGCPTSQISKPEIRGAIYRVRRQAAPSVMDPRGVALQWDRLELKDLVSLLDDPRWVVRDRAVHQLGKRGPGVVPILQETIQENPAPRARRNAVWSLTRMENPEARAAVRAALSDKSGSVRLSAASSAGLWRDPEALERLRQLALADDMPAVRREAAMALGRIGSRAAAPALLEAIRAGDDRFLEHAQIYALIRIADRAACLKGLEDSSPRVRRAALIALDQADNGDLAREQVVPLLESSDGDLQRAALKVVIARPAWADGVADLLRRWLTGGELPESHRSILQTALPGLSKQPLIQEIIAEAMRGDATPLATRLLLLELMAQAAVETLPASWSAELRRAVEQGDERILRQAVATLRARSEAGFDDLLVRVGMDTKHSSEARLAALGAVAARLGEPSSAVFDFLQSQLEASLPALTRLAAASALSHLKLDGPQLERLTDVVGSAEAVELPYLLVPFERSRSPGVGKRLVAALGRAPGVESLSPDAPRLILKEYPTEVQEAAAPLLERLRMGAAKQKARLDELEPALAGGNKAMGRTIFFGDKAVCAGCHTVGSAGGKIGPDLSKIGGIRAPRDLLESIVFPSASIVRGYEPFTITTQDGVVHSGILGRDTAEAVTLIATDRSEVRIPRSSVDEIQPSRVSIMPQGLDTQLSRQELSDLIAFLASLK
jgi:putative membrane-bound dehydrogenase-like protein